MDAESLLQSTKLSLLIIEQRASKDIVVGVPHHAPAGITSLPCPEHRDSDENAGFLGRYVAIALDCCSIIACNYTIDVNKSLCTDYAKQIAKWNPRVLIEIHGHGGVKAKHAIEISSGSAERERYSHKMATQLTGIIGDAEEFNSLSVCGQYSKLYFKASESVTISDNRWIAYHIELPPELRKSPDDPNGTPPILGYRFCDALTKAVREIHRF